MITWNFTAACCTPRPLQLKFSAFPFLLAHKKVAKPGIIIAEAEMAQVKITVKKNGPYRVEAPEGTIELVDSDGNRSEERRVGKECRYGWLPKNKKKKR